MGLEILDLGVGTGRTTVLVLDSCSSYLGIDSVPEMLDVARRRFPSADLRLGDARHLSGLCPPESVDIVLFSFNGIDAVDHDGRSAVIDQVRTVLIKGGLFLFSTLNEWAHL